MNNNRVPIIVGVTGHRDIPSEDSEIIKAEVQVFFKKLLSEYPNSLFKLISGLAEGADQLVAEVALDMGIQLVAALPMLQADYEQDFGSTQSLQHFRKLVSRAESCFVVPSEEITSDATRNRDLKYLALGRYIAKNSQIVIALWDGVFEQIGADGKKRILTGGTADVVRLCRSGIFSEDPSQILLPEITVLEHLWVRRQGKAVANGIVGQWAQQRDIDSKNAYDHSKKRLHSVLRSIDKFNAFVDNLQPAQTQESLRYLLGENPPQSVVANLAKPIAYYAAADAAARQQQTERSKAIKWITGLAVISIICQQVYSGPDMQWGWLAAHIIFAMLAFMEYSRYFTRGNPREQQYLDWRSLAEALRVQIFWLASGVKNSVADHYLTGDRDDLNWIRQAARNSTIGATPMYDQDLLKWVRITWLQAQWNFFLDRSPKNREKLAKFESLVSGFFLFGLAVTGFTLIVHLLGFSASFLSVLVLVSGLCFLGSAVLRTYAEQMAFEEQMNRYHAAAKLYQSVILRFDRSSSLDDVDACRKCLYFIGKEALTENAGWLKLHRQRQFEVGLG